MCIHICMVGWLVVFNVPSTARSFRDGTPIYCPLRRTCSSINTPFRPGIEPRGVAWQSITLPLRYASSTHICMLAEQNKNHSTLVLYIIPQKYNSLPIIAWIQNSPLCVIIHG